MSSKKGYHIRIDPELWERCKEKTERTPPGLSIQQLIEQFLIQYDQGLISYEWEIQTQEENQ